MYVEAIFVAAYVCSIALMAVQSVVLRGFLAHTPGIAGEADLEQFKKVARLGMRLTVASLPFLLAGIVSCILITRLYGLLGLLAILLANGILFLIGKQGKKIENRARSLKCTSPELTAEYGRISATWTKRLFPNF